MTWENNMTRGQLALLCNDMPTARQYLLLALEKAEWKYKAKTLTLLGETELKDEQFDLAKSYLLKAEANLPLKADPYTKGFTAYALAQLARLENKPKQAQQYLRQSAPLIQSIFAFDHPYHQVCFMHSDAKFFNRITPPCTESDSSELQAWSQECEIVRKGLLNRSLRLRGYMWSALKRSARLFAHLDLRFAETLLLEAECLQMYEKFDDAEDCFCAADAIIEAIDGKKSKRRVDVLFKHSGNLNKLNRYGDAKEASLKAQLIMAMNENSERNDYPEQLEFSTRRALNQAKSLIEQAYNSMDQNELEAAEAHLLKAGKTLKAFFSSTDVSFLALRTAYIKLYEKSGKANNLAKACAERDKLSKAQKLEAVLNTFYDLPNPRPSMTA